MPYSMVFTRKISAGLYPFNKKTQAAPSQRQSKQAANVLKSQLSLRVAERLSFGRGRFRTQGLQKALYKLLRSHHPPALSLWRISLILGARGYPTPWESVEVLRRSMTSV